jgi:hypothetical protein
MFFVSFLSTLDYFGMMIVEVGHSFFASILIIAFGPEFKIKMREGQFYYICF